MVTWAIPEKHRAWHMVCARGDPGEPVSWGQSSAVGFKERSGPALDECRAVGGADDSGAQAALPRGRDPPPRGSSQPWRVNPNPNTLEGVCEYMWESVRVSECVGVHAGVCEGEHTCKNEREHAHVSMSVCTCVSVNS